MKVSQSIFLWLSIQIAKSLHERGCPSSSPANVHERCLFFNSGFLYWSHLAQRDGSQRQEKCHLGPVAGASEHLKQVGI